MWIFLLVFVSSINFTEQITISIGAILNSNETGSYFTHAVEQLNSLSPASTLNDFSQNDKPGIFFNSSYILIENNPIHAAQSICDKMIPAAVHVVIVSSAPGSDLSPMSISFTCGFYKIPVIGLTTRDSSFSDKNVHNSFMRMVPPYSDQAMPWLDLLIHFKWSRIVFVHSADQECRRILGKFQSEAESKDIEISRTIQFTPGLNNYTSSISELLTIQSQVILLYSSKEDAEVIFRNAAQLNLTGSGYVWIVTEQAFDADNVPTGTLALKLLQFTDEEAHIKDALTVIKGAFTDLLLTQNITDPPHNCDSAQWKSGPIVLRTLMKQKMPNGLTGKIKFDKFGDRIQSEYEIVNLNQNRKTIVVGNYDQTVENKLSINEGRINWPGDQKAIPKGIKISTHLKVVTLQELPFVYADPIEVSGGICESEKHTIPCNWPNYTSGTQKEYCCYGYAIDLLIKLSNSVNFTYELHLAEDSAYGTYEKRNGKRRWNGAIGELIDNRADMIVAPLTIDPQRAQHIDFTKPYKYQGITILVKKTTKDSNLASFLQPFQDTLWILVGLSVHVVALVLYLLDRFSPFGRFKLAKSEDAEEDALNLSSAMWFAWGVLLNSGIGEGTPRSFSARVLGMVWAGFAMIIVASYTANLAAFLVLDRPEASISGIDDARLRNPQEDFLYATVADSAVSNYFQRQVELSTMYRTMEGRNYPNAESAIEDVRREKLQAFVWDSSRLQYEAANDCDLVTAGELFGRSGYGIGLHKNSPWTYDMSLAILNFHETGEMEKLDGTWILVKDTKCPEKDTSPATLGLTNMAGVFMMVAGGIITGVFLIFIEIAYKRYRGLKEKELELAKTAADRWRGNIEKRRTLRRTLLQQQELQKSNGLTRGIGYAEAPFFDNCGPRVRPTTDMAAISFSLRQQDEPTVPQIASLKQEPVRAPMIGSLKREPPITPSSYGGYQRVAPDDLTDEAICSGSII